MFCNLTPDNVTAKSTFCFVLELKSNPKLGFSFVQAFLVGKFLQRMFGKKMATKTKLEVFVRQQALSVQPNDEVMSSVFMFTDFCFLIIY